MIKSVEKRIFLILLILLMLAACSQKPINNELNYTAFLNMLKDNGFQYTEVEVVNDSFLSVPRRPIRIGDEIITIYAYASNMDMERDSKYINKGGSSISVPGKEVEISWVSFPHFFKKDTLIIEYVGKDEKILKFLNINYGPEFAGYGYINKQDIVENKSTDNTNANIDKAKEYLTQNWDKIKIDGSTSMVPLHQALINMFSANKEEIKHGKTVEAFEKFISGENDILLGVTYSDELLNKAKAKSIDFVGKEITKEAFVFLVNKENPVKSLTVEQIKGIYSGKISNWSEVGGDNAPIIAYQRNDDSGSQIRMNIFMGDEKLVERTYFAEGMGELVLVIAGFDNSSANDNKYAIGYNMYTFTEKQYLNENVVLLSINGIKPDDDTIFDEAYPIGIYNYLYYDRNNEIASEFAINLYTFLMSGEGQKLISSAGYVNIEEKLIRNLNVDFFGDYEDYISFYNEVKGEFYDVNDKGELLVYNNYSDFILRNSQYKDNRNAHDYITKLFNAEIISSKIRCNDTTDYIGIQRIWFDASFDPEDCFNIEFNGYYYTDLKYYFLEDKYILESVVDEAYLEYTYFRDSMLDMEFLVEAISFENLVISKDDLKNIRIRDRKWNQITKFSDIQYESLFR